MKYIPFLLLSILSFPHSSSPRSWLRGNSLCSTPCISDTCSPCILGCCNASPYCGPFSRPLPGQYASFKDNTRISFWNLPPCAPRNDSALRGYLYKGMWWDTAGVRYWAVRNNTANTITVEGLAGGDIKDIPAGDVANIIRGESYSFRVQAPARRFELFNSDQHALEIFINLAGDIDFRAEQPITKAAQQSEKQPFNPKF